MDWGDPTFVLTIIAMSMVAWIITTWIRAKHGYPLENEWGDAVVQPGSRKEQQLLSDNRMLTDRLENAEDRLAVLERIVTDEGYTTARQIEALRERKERS